MIQTNSLLSSMGLYIHIPFCVRKCNYCDFLSFPVTEEIKSPYVTALCNEIKAKSHLYGKKSKRNVLVPTIFFGGGTPSILESKHICSIMNTIYDCFNIAPDAEITIECNPGTINLLKLSDYKYLGINRLSLGLQSTCDKELAALGRIHSFTQFKESFKDARKSGFDNINVDLMSALPGQSLDSYRESIEKIADFSPEHISAYSLIIEENTPFYDIYNNYKSTMDYAPLPDEDTERDMYYLTNELLSKYGYNRYEISNYAKKGYECRHNLSYWDRVNYLGLGLGSSSLIDNVRYKNTSDLICYTGEKNTDNLISETEILSKKDIMSEFMFLGMRKMSGINTLEFSELFGVDIFDIFGDAIRKFQEENLICVADDRIYLTKKGIDVSNYVFSEFIL